MNIDRYVIAYAVKTKDNELIPIWDDRIELRKDTQSGNYISIKGDYINEHFELIECVYDLKTKQLKEQLELNYYPTDEDLEFTVGQSVFYETSHRKLKEAVISKIIYEDYKLEIKKGNKFDSFDLYKFKGINIDSNTMYAIKSWRPIFILDNNVIIKWKHQLYHKSND